MKKYDIFISYSRKDFDEVNQIVEMIKSRIPTLNCWFDITGIESGDEFKEKIITAIDNSSYVLFALSENSIQSKYTRKEILYAKNSDTKVIPLLLKDAHPKGWFLNKFGWENRIDTTNSLEIEKLIKILEDRTEKAKSDASETKQDLPKDPSHVSSSNFQIFYYRDGKKRYEGEIKNGLFHGQGTYYFVNGDKYVGEFKESLEHGQGTYYYANGDRYEGKFKEGLEHGKGILYYEDGDKYDGEFKNGLSHGKGIHYFEDGDRYEGQFINDFMLGQGTFYFKDGDRYEGEIKGGPFHGQGTYYWADGEKYVGQWKYNERHGQGTHYYANGYKKHEGQYKNNKFDGQGTYYWDNGDRYEGQWKKGKQHGQGTYYYADGTQETVTYKNGELIESSSETGILGK